MEIFNFDKDSITRHIQYELKVMRRMNKAFEFVYEKLHKQGHILDLDKSKKKLDLVKVNASKDKNYNWIAIKSGQAQLLIRSYGGHHTVYCKHTELRKIEEHEYTEKRYSAFTFFTNTKHLSDDKSDFYCENSFHDLNNALPQIIEHCLKNRIQSLWNSVGFTRPDHCEVKNCYDNESITSVDLLIFCGEELSNKFISEYSENNMLENLKILKENNKVGEQFDSRHIIKEIRTEFPKQYSDPYYHDVGIIIIDENDKTEFKDVYSLTNWYINEVNELMKS